MVYQRKNATLRLTILSRECCNKAKSDDAKQPQCPADKERAIAEALRFYGMIA